jgi:inner membrane protein
MSRVIIDLAAKWQGASSSGPLEHPAGVTLPFDNPSDAALIIPEIRSEIRSGAYNADLLALLPAAIEPGERALVIGSGLGVVSTLVAKNGDVDRVIEIEANTTLIPYLDRVHAANGVQEIETLNAVLADGKKGRVPFFARRDLRTSSLVPHDRSWQQVMMVPFMDVNLILTEEQISLIVCDIPVATAQLLAQAELATVDRILIDCGEEYDEAWEEDGVCTLLSARGYAAEIGGTAVLFRRETPARRAGHATGLEGKAVAAGVAAVPEASVSGVMQDPLLLTEGDEDETGEDTDEDSEDAFGDDMEDLGPGDLDREAEQALLAQREAAAQARAAQLEAGSAAGTDAPPLEAAQGMAPQKDGGRRPADTGGGRATRLYWLIALSLLMALPLILIGEIAGNRATRQAEVVQDVAAIWGGPQTLNGPFIVVPVTGRGGDAQAEPPLLLLPDMLSISSVLNAERRGSGVFEVPVYRGHHTFRLELDPALAVGARDAGLLADDEIALWDEAALGLGIAEPRALRGRLMLESAGDGVRDVAKFVSGAFDPRAGTEAMPGVHARIGDPRQDKGGWMFTLELDGSQELRLTPAGGLTEGRLSSNWPDPRFSGAFRPVRRVTGGTGFEAQWTVPQLAHSMPQAFRGTEPLARLAGASFGVELRQPLDIYQTARRAAKIGLLLIAMTFGAIFLMERFADRRPHVVHYALVGAAQCVFFALLISLAEQIGFTRAYAVATVATVPLLTSFAWFVLRLGPRSGWLTLALSVLYCVVYLILSAEEQALLMGAVLAFLAVAAVMWGTRNEDWTATIGAMRARSRPPPSVEGRDE